MHGGDFAVRQIARRHSDAGAHQLRPDAISSNTSTRIYVFRSYYRINISIFVSNSNYRNYFFQHTATIIM